MFLSLLLTLIVILFLFFITLHFYPSLVKLSPLFTLLLTPLAVLRLNKLKQIK